MFTDRHDAGRQLAGELKKYRNAEAVVLAVPRGGVVVGYEIAIMLGLQLDIIPVRKVEHPFSPEFAIGVVNDEGDMILNNAEAANHDMGWLQHEIRQKQEEARRRAELYRGERRQADAMGKIAIVVDDGMATGLTMRLAVRAARGYGPREVVIAVPVAPPEAVFSFATEGVSEIVLLEPPELFAGSVAAHYADFDQVNDVDVTKLLREAESG